MKLFDFFRTNERAGEVGKRRARQAPSRFVRMQVECLESRSLLSVAPPSASLMGATSYQPNSYEDSSPWAGMASQLRLPTGPAYSLAPTGPDLNFSLPSQSSGGQIYIRPLTGSQAEPLLSNNVSGYGGIILNNSFGGLAQTQGSLGNTTAADYFNNEARDVHEMLSLLRYVPSSATTEEQSHQPVIVQTNGNFTPTFDSIPLAASVGNGAPASSDLAVPDATDNSAAGSTGLLAPASTSTSAPASTGTSAPVSSGLAAPASTGTTPPSAGITSPASTGLTAAASASTTAPASTASESPAQSSPLHATEGGMVTLLRQSIAAHSAVDALSLAAIDALLETPAKVDSVQGRFQAFEISVSNEQPPPIAPPPASGAQINLPFRPEDRQTPAAADPNFHRGWSPADSTGASAIPNLYVGWMPPISTAAMPTADNLSAAEPASLGDLPTEAVDEVFSSGPRFDLATAAILAALVGRALWPARPAVEVAEENAKSEARPRSARLRLDRLVPGC